MPSKRNGNNHLSKGFPKRTRTFPLEKNPIEIKKNFRTKDIRSAFSRLQLYSGEILTLYKEVSQYLIEQPTANVHGLTILERSHAGLLREMQSAHPRFTKEHYQARLAQLQKEMNEIHAAQEKRKRLIALRKELKRTLDDIAGGAEPKA